MLNSFFFSILHLGPKIWNSLPLSVPNSTCQSSKVFWKLIVKWYGLNYAWQAAKTSIHSNLSVRTPLYCGQFPMYRQNSHTFPLKKPLQYGPFLMRTTDTKFGPWEQIHTNVTSLLRTLRDKVSIICGICTISCRQLHKHWHFIGQGYQYQNMS